MRRLVVFFFGIISLTAAAQVQNNSYKDRIKITQGDQWLHTTTAKSTVEWECVNKALTNKCLVYHNDQWFYFSVNEPGNYFLNLAAQECRDKRGIQVFIIEGNPCESSDYRIIHCASDGLQNDTFIPLEQLKSNTPYLVNIDGFLGDQCTFDIQIATKPNGLPTGYKNLELFKPNIIQKEKLVEISCASPRDMVDELASFKVYLRKPGDRKNNLERDIVIQRNTYGASVLQYSFSDTLNIEGIYTYEIFGIQKQTLLPLLLARQQVSYTEVKRALPSWKVSIPLEYDRSANYDVMIYDQTQMNVLKKFKDHYNVQNPKPIEIDFSEFLKNGKSFMVLVMASTSKAKEYYYKVDAAGKIVEDK